MQLHAQWKCSSLLHPREQVVQRDKPQGPYPLAWDSWLLSLCQSLLVNEGEKGEEKVFPKRQSLSPSAF